MQQTPVLGNLDSLARCRLAHLPTPIEAMPNLTAAVDGATLLVKRDDCTGLAFGGNKIRQLEFYLGEAMQQKADTILITGAVQSNFVRSAAAAAAKCGMGCHVQLEERVPNPSEVYRRSGNVLLDQILGAKVYSYPSGEDEAGADRKLGEIARQLTSEGKKPYIVPLSPGHPPLGALGYVDAARELVGQLRQSRQSIDEIVVASGSGSTHAGLLFGLKALGCDARVHGVCVRRSAELQAPRIIDHCAKIAALLGCPNPVADADVLVDDWTLAPGYGRMNKAVADAICQAARTEALMVDPVYTGRVVASTIAMARQLRSDKTMLIIHTGGSPAIFAYEPELIDVTASA